MAGVAVALHLCSFPVKQGGTRSPSGRLGSVCVCLLQLNSQEAAGGGRVGRTSPCPFPARDHLPARSPWQQRSKSRGRCHLGTHSAAGRLRWPPAYRSWTRPWSTSFLRGTAAPENSPARPAPAQKDRNWSEPLGAFVLLPAPGRKRKLPAESPETVVLRWRRVRRLWAPWALLRGHVTLNESAQVGALMPRLLRPSFKVFEGFDYVASSCFRFPATADSFSP